MLNGTWGHQTAARLTMVDALRLCSIAGSGKFSEFEATNGDSSARFRLGRFIVTAPLKGCSNDDVVIVEVPKSYFEQIDSVPNSHRPFTTENTYNLVLTISDKNSKRYRITFVIPNHRLPEAKEKVASFIRDGTDCKPLPMKPEKVKAWSSEARALTVAYLAKEVADVTYRDKMEELILNSVRENDYSAFLLVRTMYLKRPQLYQGFSSEVKNAFEGYIEKHPDFLDGG